MRNAELLGLVITSVGTACWIVCFWWMHRISKRQDAMLVEMHEVMARIEKLSEEEHELIREVHPVVGEIRASMGNVADAVGAETN